MGPARRGYFSVNKTGGHQLTWILIHPECLEQLDDNYNPTSNSLVKYNYIWFQLMIAIYIYVYIVNYMVINQQKAMELGVPTL